jgi:hypothetical protein
MHECPIKAARGLKALPQIQMASTSAKAVHKVSIDADELVLKALTRLFVNSPLWYYVDFMILIFKIFGKVHKRPYVRWSAEEKDHELNLNLGTFSNFICSHEKGSNIYIRPHNLLTSYPNQIMTSI